MAHLKLRHSSCKRKRRLRKTELMYLTLLCMLLCVEYEDALTWLNFHAWLVRVLSLPIFDIFSFWMTRRASYVCFSLCLLVCLFQPIFFFAHVCVFQLASYSMHFMASYFANATPSKSLSYFPNCNFYGCNHSNGIVAFVFYVHQQFVDLFLQ